MLRSAVQALYEVAKQGGDVVYLSADNGTEYDFLFAREFAGRYYNVGIAEGNMVGMAAGLAASGRVPFVTTAAPFLAYRAYEFIRDDVCMQRRKVVFLAHGSGMSVGMLGPTHHSTEDLALLSTLPGLEVLCPSCAAEAADMVRYAYTAEGPVYIRIEMAGPAGKRLVLSNCASVADDAVLREGGDLAIVTVGSVADEALAAAKALSGRGVEAEVVSVRRASPFDPSTVLAAVGRGMPVLVVEEHSSTFGLADRVRLSLAGSGLVSRVASLSTGTGFAAGYGTQGEMRAQNGLDAASIETAAVGLVRGGAR